MNEPDDGRRITVVGAVVMTLVLVWSGALAVGFTWAAATGSDSMGTSRRLIFSLIAAFLGLLAVRTGYELVRRLLRR